MCGPGPPVGALPRYLAFLSSFCTPPLTTGPCCFPAPPVSRTASPAPRRPPLFTSPPPPRVRAAAFDHAARSHPNPTSTLWAAAPEALSLSRFPSSTRHRADHPLPFPSLVPPHVPTDLEKPPAPHSALFHVHTRARAPLLLHCLRTCLIGSRHWRPLLSGSCPSITVVRHYR
jgi:hypothetical protein